MKYSQYLKRCLRGTSGFICQIFAAILFACGLIAEAAVYLIAGGLLSLFFLKSLQMQTPSTFIDVIWQPVGIALGIIIWSVQPGSGKTLFRIIAEVRKIKILKRA
ncbi:MAG TPA: hypothetical protein P5080_03025 [Candidatus Paceibacterota bacterium]|nr:hypothetical protein [Candidatus Pacearchaeota archaeon]HRZ50941.1 hypothetical protein [Candidatus Paceibacterota bacterium]HSA36662.1 hypothetical protein [Candidatus Paceibacterota bacterium]